MAHHPDPSVTITLSLSLQGRNKEGQWWTIVVKTKPENWLGSGLAKAASSTWFWLSIRQVRLSLAPPVTRTEKPTIKMVVVELYILYLAVTEISTPAYALAPHCPPDVDEKTVLQAVQKVEDGYYAAVAGSTVWRSDMKTRTLALSLGAFCLLVLAAVFVFYDGSGSPAESTTVKQSPLVRDSSPVIGPENAPVTIVEFFDPSCEGCRAMHPYVKQIQGIYPDKVRLVLRYVLFHKGSEEAVRILETARNQGVYVPVLDAVMKAQPQWHDDAQVKAAWEAAEAAGLDVEKARSQMNSPAIDAIIQQDAADVKKVGITGTPTFYVNGQPLSKLGPQQLYDLVTSEVNALK